MTLRQVAQSLSLLGVLLLAAPAHAESPIDKLKFSSSLESGRMIPTSSTKQLVVVLQLLVPLSATSNVFAGLGPRAFTQELLTSEIPQILAVGWNSSLTAEF